MLASVTITVIVPCHFLELPLRYKEAINLDKVLEFKTESSDRNYYFYVSSSSTTELLNFMYLLQRTIYCHVILHAIKRSSTERNESVKDLKSII